MTVLSYSSSVYLRMRSAYTRANRKAVKFKILCQLCLLARGSFKLAHFIMIRSTLSSITQLAIHLSSSVAGTNQKVGRFINATMAINEGV